MSGLSKFLVIALLVIAIIVVSVIDMAIKSKNGFGIPALLKYLIIFPLIGAIIAVARR